MVRAQVQHFRNPLMAAGRQCIAGKPSGRCMRCMGGARSEPCAPCGARDAQGLEIWVLWVLFKWLFKAF